MSSSLHFLRRNLKQNLNQLIRPSLRLIQFLMQRLLIRSALLVIAGSSCLSAANGQDSSPDSDLALQNRYEQLQQRIQALENDQGNFDGALLEPLVSLSESAIELNLFYEAGTLLDRAIQIERRNSGLLSSGQIPLYFKLAESNLRAQNWVGVTESLDYLYWLLVEKQVGDETELIDNLLRLSDLHLLAIAGDAQRRADHFRESEQLIFIAQELSDVLPGETLSSRLSLYYRLIKQFYLQSIAVERGGNTGYALREIIQGSTWIRPKQQVQSRYYRAGLRLFSDMEELLIESLESLERPAENLAMLALYRADWRLLFNDDRAEDAYLSAYQALAGAVDNPEDLGRLFAHPALLPVPDYYATVSDALVAMKDNNAPATADAAGHSSPFTFTEWFNAMPATPLDSSALPAALQPAKYEVVLLSFQLNALHPVSNWVSGTYRTHYSVADNFEILNGTENNAIDRDYLQRQLHFLRFRPRLENGVPQPFQGRLLYHAAINPNTGLP